MSLLSKQSEPFQILMVSKPLAPPWNDSSKNLVKDVVQYLEGYKIHILCPKGQPLFIKENIVHEFIYNGDSQYSPGLRQNFKVLLRLLKPDPEIVVYHFFFAPNLLTSTVARLILKFKKKRSVQSVMSTPKNYKKIRKLIFADSVIVLSDHCKRNLLKNGIKNVSTISPGLDISRFRKDSFFDSESLNLKFPSGYILYPGDYEFSGAIQVIKNSLPLVLKKLPQARFVFACRLKTKKAKECELRIKKQLKEAGVLESVEFLNEVENMFALISRCSLCIFPALDMYAKMDIPLVLLETLWLKKPIIISDISPLNEIMKDYVGLMVKPGDFEELSRAIIRLVSDKKLASQFGKNGRRVVEKYFDIKKIARQYGNLYNEICRETDEKENERKTFFN